MQLEPVLVVDGDDLLAGGDGSRLVELAAQGDPLVHLDGVGVGDLGELGLGVVHCEVEGPCGRAGDDPGTVTFAISW